MNKYTSLKLSKLLTDNGFEGESELVWSNGFYDNDNVVQYGKFNTLEINCAIGMEELSDKRKFKAYKKYDILNDLCVKYAKEMFGEELSENTARFDHAGYCTLDNSDNAILQIGTLLRLNEKDKAEEYLWEHCLFNKNKL